MYGCNACSNHFIVKNYLTHLTRKKSGYSTGVDCWLGTDTRKRKRKERSEKRHARTHQQQTKLKLLSYRIVSQHPSRVSHISLAKARVVVVLGQTHGQKSCIHISHCSSSSSSSSIVALLLFLKKKILNEPGGKKRKKRRE
jgi:hypothetical protein